MRRGRGTWLLAVTTLVGATLTQVEVPSSNAKDGEASDSSAVSEDAAQLAKALGLDLAAAEQYVSQQPAVWALDAELRAEALGFAGMYIEYEPEYRLVVLTTGSVGFITEHVEDVAPALARDVEIRQVAYTEEDLRATIARLSQELRGIPFGADGDITTGVVTIMVETEVDASLAADVVKGTRQLPLPTDSVEIRVVGPVPDTTDFACTGSADDVCGGEYLHDASGNPHCTAGFTVNDGSGHEGTATTAHCNNMLRHEGVDLDFEGGHNEGEYDIQWHTTPGLADLPKVKDGDSTPRDITAKLPRVDQTTGTWVCMYGDATDYHCGYLRSKVYQPWAECTETPNPTPTYMRVEDYDAWYGDSGGPTYAGNTALGFVKGPACGWGDPLQQGSVQYYYMAQNYLSILDVSVSTT